MAFKFIPIFAAISLTLAIEGVDYNTASNTRGGDVLPDGYQVQRVLQAPVYKQIEQEQFAPAAYDFNYQVHDEHTGDIKSQKEVRNGDSVQGRYELIDSDGFRRIVEYTADNHNGFNAVVHREPVDIKIPQPIPQDRKLSYSAPVIRDIPVQAYPVTKLAAYAVPKYPVPARNAPQYYTASPYAANGHYNQGQGVVSQSAAVFSTPVHSAALQNADQASEAPQQQTPAAPVQFYYRPAQNNQAYSTPVQTFNTYTPPAYNTIAYSAPYYSQQNNAVLGNNAYEDTFAAYKQKYFLPPALKTYYTSPTASKLTYSAPSAAAGYTAHIRDESNYSNLVQSNGQASQGRYVTSTGSVVRPTQSPAAVSEDPKFDVRSNGASQQLGNSAQSETGSSSPYAVSTTPVYKH